ncbi:indole-3-acetaldehyde oxidase-like [Hermetia illucens]|uniref:indole-3-acetaldehyde oxidase-like n=1 Tax=Hermetia illucens TaxID=343691 RepID=UPI0018CC7873|nr:indole-3-acetaldehyde oxidase-like [Hermetia illucens]
MGKLLLFAKANTFYSAEIPIAPDYTRRECKLANVSDQLIEMSEEDRLEAFTTTKLLNPQSTGYLQREKVFDEKLQEVMKPEEYPADITLNTFIREYAKLFGTKFYCLEGGCSCCTVTVRTHHPVSNKYYSRAANSCLVLLNICHGWDIVTIEGLGDRRSGYHPLQERLAQFNGTQCGYCSPGMIMNMFSLLEASGGKVSAEEIENSFGGNLCRCTGYRPILETMKSFASDCDYEFVEKECDIEDLRLCSKIGQICDRKCSIPKIAKVDDQRVWYHPRSLSEIFQIFEDIHERRYTLIAGGTAHGVYRRDPNIEVFIEVNNVTELHSYKIGDVVELGANVTLTGMMRVLKEAAARPGFEYFEETLRHLDLVASVQIRNFGTIAGNLMTKHDHNGFVSDIFTILLSIDARIVVANPSSQVERSLIEFFKSDMRHRIIVKIILPQWNKSTTLYGSYKILPRAQHAHALVNAGFHFTFSGSQINSSRIAFGGINPNFTESHATVEFFEGRNLFDPDTFTQSLEILGAELQPDWILPAASPEFRRRLALGLFYKFLIKNAPEGLVKVTYRSGGHLLQRPVSSGTQYFDTNKKEWPVNQPVRKLEALWQCSGEATYSNDIPQMHEEVWAAFVPATRVHATVAKIDPF